MLRTAATYNVTCSQPMNDAAMPDIDDVLKAAAPIQSTSANHCDSVPPLLAEPMQPPHLLQGKTQFKLKREMSAGALEGRVMKMLCAISGAKTVLEVGMFTGTSALAMAEIIPDDGKVSSFPAATQFMPTCCQQ